MQSQNYFHSTKIFVLERILIRNFLFLSLLKILFGEFQVATRIMKQIIDQFALFDLFGRDNYEYYARVTGRVLRVQDEWICSFRYPAPPRGKSRHDSVLNSFCILLKQFLL